MASDEEEHHLARVMLRTGPRAIDRLIAAISYPDMARQGTEHRVDTGTGAAAKAPCRDTCSPSSIAVAEHRSPVPCSVRLPADASFFAAPARARQDPNGHYVRVAAWARGIDRGFGGGDAVAWPRPLQTWTRRWSMGTRIEIRAAGARPDGHAHDQIYEVDRGSYVAAW